MKRPPPAAAVLVERIGVDGDGVGALGDGPVYIPFTLPQEVVTAQPLRPRGEGWLATATSIDQPSPERMTAPCDYFGRCGGCLLQHWRDDAYATWKTALLTAALARAGYAALPSSDLARGLPGERRRLDFAVRRGRGGVVVGLHGAGSAEVVDLAHCLILHPVLMGLIAPLRAVLRDLSALKREASVVINLLGAGPDVLLRVDGALSLADRTTLTAFARMHGVARVSGAVAGDAPETICLLRPPVSALSGVPVRVPPGAFLQATAAGERAIVAAVLAGLPAKRAARARVAELYAGVGTLSFALAVHVRVTAYEGDPASVAALKQAANQAGLAGRVEAVQRDLVRQPLSVKELGAFAAVVLDPPHAGAATQIAQLAAAKVPVVIYVSCNPATLGRDAKMLRDAGYRIDGVTAIDQFLWSARLESVVVFRR